MSLLPRIPCRKLLTDSRYALPGLLLDDSLRTVCYAALWTGLVTTAANRIAETVALGRLASSEASVLLATEPLWAAGFAALAVAGRAVDIRAAALPIGSLAHALVLVAAARVALPVLGAQPRVWLVDAHALHVVG